MDTHDEQHDDLDEQIDGTASSTIGNDDKDSDELDTDLDGDEEMTSGESSSGASS